MKKKDGNLPAPRPSGYRSLQAFDDYVNLIEETINGVYDGSIDAKKANSVGMLCGYGLNALREARGGKQKMSVFLSDMRKINVEMLSQDEMDRFLQGDENTQIELLQTLEGRGGVIEAEVVMTPKKEVKPETNLKLLSNITGIEVENVKDALSGAGNKPNLTRPKHDWQPTLAGTGRFCMNCGEERNILNSKDAETACSGNW